MGTLAGPEVDAAVPADATATAYREVVECLEPAVTARVLAVEGLGRYRFEYDLYRETLYQDSDGRPPRTLLPGR